MAAYSPEILLLAALPQGLVAANHQHQITLISPAIARIFALDVDQWLGQPLDAFCSAYDIPTPKKLTERRQAFKYGWQRLYVELLPLPREAARSDLAIVLMISPEDAEHRAMMDFIGTISHELRTPLTVIRGFANLLLRDDTTPLHPDHRELIEFISERGSDLTSLINNFIMVAGLEMGHFKPDCEALDLNKVIEVALAPLQGQIATKGLRLTIELPTGSWANLYCCSLTVIAS
jgi:signal transduction histidine kinase